MKQEKDGGSVLEISEDQLAFISKAAIEKHKEILRSKDITYGLAETDIYKKRAFAMKELERIRKFLERYV